MADKKLNEVQKVTDMAYVPVIMSDGSIGQIAKADLASVVAGVMNDNVVGSDHASFDSIYYDNGIIYGKGKGSIQLGAIIYTPNGRILV